LLQCMSHRDKNGDGEDAAYARATQPADGQFATLDELSVGGWSRGAKGTILWSRGHAARRRAAAMKYVAHFGYNGASEGGIVKRYAEDLGYSYKWQGCETDMFRAATVLKNASMAVIWNGLQAGTSLATRLCRRRSIPTCYVEWGLLPQETTFCIDPTGFCA